MHILNLYKLNIAKYWILLFSYMLISNVRWPKFEVFEFFNITYINILGWQIISSKYGFQIRIHKVLNNISRIMLFSYIKGRSGRYRYVYLLIKNIFLKNMYKN